jgi:phenylacetate-CoA ligase
MRPKIDHETVYRRLPIVLQNLSCSFHGRAIQSSRFDSSFWCMLAASERRTAGSYDEVSSLRNRRLQAFVQGCAAHVPFYREWFRSAGVDPCEVRSIPDLQALPVLTKAQVLERPEQFLSERIPSGERVPAHTSGTTGGGLRFSTTLAAIQEQWAVWWRYRRWHGLQPGTWCGYFGGRSVVPLSQARPPFWRYNVPGRQILFSAYHMSPSHLSSYAYELRRRRPPWLHGYPSLLSTLAAHLLEHEVDLGYGVQWITTGAENLMPHQSEMIERAFGVRPRQHYGMAEAVANISECEQGTLHVDEDFAAVEFLPDPSGTGYRIVGCNLSNPATPLLRYEVQDLASLSETSCSCGQPGRTVVSIDGRLEDFVILPGGARLGRLDHVFKDLTNVREAQIFQRRVGEIRVRVVRSRSYGDADERLLLRELRTRIGVDTAVKIDYLESLPRSSNGKLRFVVSEIPEGQWQRAA